MFIDFDVIQIKLILLILSMEIDACFIEFS